MSAGELTAPRANPRTGLVALAVILALILGIVAGGVVTLAVSGPGVQQPANPATAAACATTAFVNYRRLAGNMGAAADRHDIRAYVGYRNDLAKLMNGLGLEGSAQLVGALQAGCWD